MTRGRPVHINRWDDELRELAREISAVEARVNAAQRQEQSFFERKKRALQRYQVAIEKLCQRLSHFQRGRFKLPVKQAAVIYWGSVFSEKAFDLYKRRARLIGHEMWLELVHRRLSGKASGSMIENNDLVDFAVRESHLRKTESYLGDKLIRTRLTIGKLEARQHEVEVTLANRSAAASLQGRLGGTAAEAFANPRYRALVTYVKWLTASVRGTTEDETRLHDLKQRISSKTDAVVGACREMILKNHGVNQQSGARRLQLGLEEIDALQDEIERLSLRVMDRLPAEASPKLVKKSPSHARNGGLKPTSLTS